MYAVSFFPSAPNHPLQMAASKWGSCKRHWGPPEYRREGRAMPLHDWTDERGWDSVHPLWLTYLLEYVQERLPEGYKAFLGGVPSLTVDSGQGKPDVSVRQWGPRPPAEEVTTDTAVLEPDLEASVAIRLDPQRAVHIDFHGQLIA